MAGVIKDLILIGYSVVVSGAMVSATQYSGYFLAFVGVTAYSSYKPLAVVEGAGMALCATARRPGLLGLTTCA